MSWMEVVEVLCGQFYYPLEHLAWAADNRLISLNSTHLWTAAIILWAIPLFISLVKSLKELLCSIQQPRRTPAVATPSSLQQQQKQALVNLIKCTCDLGLAIFWLPQGWLWSGRLPASVWGLLGTISSLLGLYQTQQQLKDTQLEH